MNDYFSLCRQQSNDLSDIYNCCYNVCLSDTPKQSPYMSKVKSICNATCNRIYPDEFKNIVPECIVKEKCWDNIIIKECATQKKRQIEECCIEKCHKINTDRFLDCKKYCSRYKIDGVH